MRSELAKASHAHAALFEAVVPFVDYVADRVPGIPAASRLVLVVQPHPLVVRACVAPLGGGAFVEVLRRFDPDIPGGHAIAEAAAAFLAGGLSALPAAAADGIFESAAELGAGFCVLVDTYTGSVRCLLSRPGQELSASVELFSIAIDDRNDRAERPN